jgi:VIT1/CCC1 family predicted Fe2+/Mn2+ transporter
VLTLVALGVSSSKYGGAKPARPVLRVVIGGLIAIAVTMAVGKLFGAAVA